MPSLDAPRLSSTQPTRSEVPQAGNAPDDAASGRYGRLGVVPWSFFLTLRGLVFTLAPWYAYILAEQFSTKTALPTAPLARNVDITQGLSVLVLTMLIEGAFLIAPLYYALSKRLPGTTRAEGLRALGFRSAPIASSLLLVLASIVAVLAVSYVYAIIVNYFHLGLETNVQGLVNGVHIEPVTVICTLIGAVFVAPICEEVFFRGFAFAGLLRGTNFLWAALISAALFTAAHGDLGSAAPLFILGLLLANLRWRSESIWPSIALHMCNNLVASIFVIGVLLHR